MKAKTFVVKGKAETFPPPAGWVFVRVPKKLTEPLKPKKRTGWGLIPIEAEVGKTSWQTSLLPMGKGKYFIALKAKVRKTEDIRIGDTVTVAFRLA